MNQNKIRLLCIGRDLRGGGAERVQMTLLNHLSRDRFDIRLFFLSDQGELHDLIPQDIQPEFGVSRNGGLKRKGAFVFKKILSLAKQCDVVFAMQEGTPLYLAILAGKLAYKPVVGWIHINWPRQLQELSPWNKWASISLYPLANKLITVSGGVALSLRSFSPNLKDRIIVLRNPLPVREIRELALQKLPDVAIRISEKTTLLAVGRFTNQKGFDILLQAFSELIKKGYDLNLLILGEGPERSNLENLAIGLGVREHVWMPGFLKNPYPLFKMASLFVLSSRYEGLPTVMLEAMALGLPIIASDCPSGPREILEDGKNGILVPAEDSIAMATEIERLITFEQHRKMYTLAGLERVKDYDAKRAAVDFERVLNDLATEGTHLA